MLYEAAIATRPGGGDPLSLRKLEARSNLGRRRTARPSRRALSTSVGHDRLREARWPDPATRPGLPRDGLHDALMRAIAVDRALLWPARLPTACPHQHDRHEHKRPGVLCERETIPRAPIRSARRGRSRAARSRRGCSGSAGGSRHTGPASRSRDAGWHRPAPDTPTPAEPPVARRRSTGGMRRADPRPTPSPARADRAANRDRDAARRTPEPLIPRAGPRSDRRR